LEEKSLKEAVQIDLSFRA